VFIYVPRPINKLMIALNFNNCVRLAFSQKCFDTIECNLYFTTIYVASSNIRRIVLQLIGVSL